MRGLYGERRLHAFEIKQRGEEGPCCTMNLGNNECVGGFFRMGFRQAYYRKERNPPFPPHNPKKKEKTRQLGGVFFLVWKRFEGLEKKKKKKERKGKKVTIIFAKYGGRFFLKKLVVIFMLSQVHIVICGGRGEEKHKTCKNSPGEI